MQSGKKEEEDEETKYFFSRVDLRNENCSRLRFPNQPTCLVQAITFSSEIMREPRVQQLRFLRFPFSFHCNFWLLPTSIFPHKPVMSHFHFFFSSAHIPLQQQNMSIAPPPPSFSSTFAFPEKESKKCFSFSPLRRGYCTVIAGVTFKKHISFFFSFLYGETRGKVGRIMAMQSTGSKGGKEKKRKRMSIHIFIEQYFTGKRAQTNFK